jgi:hypothetical protein
MGGRILRIELRRSVALWAALVIAATGVFVLFAANEPYGTWMQLIIVQRDIMQLTWPLALSAGAWQALRERRSRVEELLATTPRPRWQRVLPVATAMALAAVAAYLAMLAGAAGHLKNIDGYFPIGAVPIIALGALAMVGAAWLGQAIGTLLPSPLTVPMLAVIGFVGLAVSPMVVAQDSRDPGAFLLLPYLRVPGGGSIFHVLSARATLSQAVWFLALAVAGLAVVAASRPRTRVAALLPIALGAAIAVPALPRTLSVAWIEDRRALEIVCTDGAPTVCISRLHAHALDDLRGPAAQALSVLAAKLPPAPTRVVVRSLERKGPNDPQPPDTLTVNLPFLEDVTQNPSEDDLLWIMLDGAGVTPCADLARPNPQDEPTNKGNPDRREGEYAVARMVAAAWLLDRDIRPVDGRDEGPDETLARQALAALRALPADEQRARVIALRDAERTCVDGDRLEMLTGTDTAR